MLNEKRIRLMTKLARYESGEGKEELRIANRSVETIVDIDRQKEQENEKENEEQKNFRSSKKPRAAVP